ncbi:MAG: MotA/TolQ/ExbB proton channel family protein [Pseudomonadota bacterium]
MSLIEFFRVGGPALIALLLCSVIVVALALEKFFFLGNFNRQVEVLHQKAEKLILENKLHEARGLCHTVHHLVGTPYGILLEGAQGNLESWKERIARRLIETQLGLKKSLWIMATIGSIAPFLGLFGTVLGIMRSFHAIGAAGKSGFNVIATGLAEALVTTAIGILVAIIAMIIFNYFQTRITSINIYFKNKMEDLIEILLKSGGNA